jgi:hypothetical protein
MTVPADPSRAQLDAAAATAASMAARFASSHDALQRGSLSRLLDGGGGSALGSDAGRSDAGRSDATTPSRSGKRPAAENVDPNIDFALGAGVKRRCEGAMSSDINKALLEQWSTESKVYTPMLHNLNVAQRELCNAVAALADEVISTPPGQFFTMREDLFEEAPLVPLAGPGAS